MFTRIVREQGWLSLRLLPRRFKSSLAVTQYDHKYITVAFDENSSVQFSNVFLRDACPSPESIEASSSQKLFTTGSIIKDLKIKSKPKVVTDSLGNECLQVVWSQNNKDHISEYPRMFLEHYATRSSRLEGQFFGYDRVFWDNDKYSKVFPEMNISYHEYLNNDSTFFKAVKSLNQYGLVFVNGAPDSDMSQIMTEENTQQWPVAKLAEKFGYIKKTFYGTLFDVKNIKDAKNIAYTNVFLPLHMDLLYYESPPGLQLLHAIKNSTLGGENIFCDSFLAAKHIRETDPSAFLALTQIPLTYKYDNDKEFYYYQRPLIVEDEIFDTRTHYPFIKEVNYSPPFQGPFELGITRTATMGSSAAENGNHFMFNDFIRGLSLFEDFINDPVNHFQIKLPEGTCVVFDNRRVLHSRNEFSDSNGGDRWLMGAYVDGDSFRSKLRIAHKKSD
ncbi:gamma-butyrobetaine dioxygenase [Yamadazyma tenuis]|uniref:Gamma-butyrobetaine dioxygenase n=1 Tax=Candida tenuis (strain ATCC 10573 / BCRC 21748 / CBS 615 / JCM 9827 / NBRC 10315 / NRRL Y-1498 / VKM Y-70) TaxID=590646 RepID=G3B014_CANTC|nr:gamma-butyrobetaine dioxygenase [Yamadazyma tenuis ATCC 10573]XP_006685181.1 uncharacterized protein CANTEDRAFT_113026 [Yamadazyma tenuis ATCC 10573]EGV65494.1 gamma-butyrobetaine dioxygenase [Yamadazyma tenuis ATCC 10573]EGV65495.1 hypothetical protein CANTEDRAFT_113026 [Yamadazyma tenuis ATCC 10573]WEJ95054.1 gamma-butyrobetaine dioxygenase [Yamadazyma tenuis]